MASDQQICLCGISLNPATPLARSYRLLYHILVRGRRIKYSLFLPGYNFITLLPSSRMLLPYTTIRKALALIFLLFITTTPLVYSQVSVEMLIVGGGGGGGRNAGTFSSGGGGASGGQVTYSTTTCSPSDILSVVVGSGGLGYRNSPLVNQTNGNSSTITFNSTTWTAVGGNAGGNATSSSSSGTGGVSVNTDLSGAGGRGGIYNNGNTVSGWPVAGGNGTSSYSSWGAATATGENNGSGVYYYAGGGAGGNWGGQLGSGVANAGLGGGGRSNTDALVNTGGGGGGANSNGSSGFDLPGGNGGSGIVIIRYTGTPVATGGTVVQSGGYTYHTFTSNGTLTVNATLPVHLVSFTAINTSSGQQLKWKVQNEEAFSHYEIETSTNASSFKNIGRIIAAKKEQYSFINNNPAPANNCYRLKMVDIDGTYTYSKVILVLNKGDNQSIRIYPNPTPSTLNVSCKNEIKVITITDYNGRQVLHAIVNSNTTSLNISQLTAGVYQAHVVTTNGIITERITKE